MQSFTFSTPWDRGPDTRGRGRRHHHHLHADDAGHGPTPDRGSGSGHHRHGPHVHAGCGPDAAPGSEDAHGPRFGRGPRAEFGPGRGPGGGERGPGRGSRGPGRHGRGGPRGRGPGGPFGPGGRGGDPELPGFLPGGARVGRGDIRAGILVLLLEGPMHGYQLLHELHERSGGVWRPSPGSVYPTLKRLAAEGLVTSTESEGRGGRRAHTLTDEGRAEAERVAAESTPWEDLGGTDDQDAVELRDLMVSVVDAARQVVRVAGPGQIADAKTTLVEARRRLYGILAADPAETGDPSDPAGDDEAPGA
ncbi:PadR family transcriptional regulator [Patulibacter americanus]|uniref:PadR family transcriptional regulator n=1 Tax=Patulibacter americanus TaxID=588672 RepID=UPI0003B61863|nr:PadR family transcriptional regulator [Patulibacter americanus]